MDALIAKADAIRPPGKRSKAGAQRFNVLPKAGPSKLPERKKTMEDRSKASNKDKGKGKEKITYK